MPHSIRDRRHENTKYCVVPLYLLKLGDAQTRCTKSVMLPSSTETLGTILRGKLIDGHMTMMHAVTVWVGLRRASGES